MYIMTLKQKRQSAGPQYEWYFAFLYLYERDLSFLLVCSSFCLFLFCFCFILFFFLFFISFTGVTFHFCCPKQNSQQFSSKRWLYFYKHAMNSDLHICILTQTNCRKSQDSIILICCNTGIVPYFRLCNSCCLNAIMFVPRIWLILSS